jgi:predicted AAA+ superfamily ATPase
MIKRLLVKMIDATSKSILLLGPRQVGKSTLLSSLRPDLTINLARENEFLRYSADIDLFSNQIEGSKAELIFVDEIQRIPGLLNTVQAIIDESKGKRSLRFLLSGSSARKLRRGQANLLPGRVLSYEMGGLCLRELDYKVDTARALKLGLLPEPYSESSFSESEKLLSSYSAIYLHEEIQAEALSRSIQGFARFLTTMAAVAGQIVDFSKIASRAKVSRSSCVRFVEILEDTLIAERIMVFEGAEGADIIRHPKLYFFDVGVLNGLLNNFSASNDRMGLLFEHLVYSQIRNSALAHDQPVSIQYFRTRHGVEVDFIVTIGKKIWAIEAKAGEVHESDLTGLKAFRSYFPQVHQCVLVSPREKRRKKDGILICDWVTMIQEMGF